MAGTRPSGRQGPAPRRLSSVRELVPSLDLIYKKTRALFSGLSASPLGNTREGNPPSGQPAGFLVTRVELLP